MVFGPGPFVSITIERTVTGADGDEVHVHAAGQGVWVARAAARLDARVTLVTTSGGEHGRVLDVLLADEPFEVTAVAVSGEGACYVDDRRDGDRDRIATRHTDLLSRHELDDLYGRALTAGLSAEVAVLCGTGEAERLPADLYRRLATDLRANDVAVVADLSGSFAERALRGGLDVLKMNADEARELDDGPVDRWLRSRRPRSPAGRAGCRPCRAVPGRGTGVRRRRGRRLRAGGSSPRDG